MFKRRKKHPSVEGNNELRVIFCHLANDYRSITLKLGNDNVKVWVVDEQEGQIFVTVKEQDKEKVNIRTGQNVNCLFYYEGKEYYGNIKCTGMGRFEDQEAIRMQIPSSITIKDDFGLTEFNVKGKKPVTFTSIFDDFIDGQLVNIGQDGVDIINRSTTPTRELLTVDRETTVDFELEPGERLFARGQVLYINNVGEELIGIRFTKVDKKIPAYISQWIADQAIAKRNADAAFLKAYTAGVRKDRDGKDGKGKGPKKIIRLENDYETRLHPGERDILLLCRDQAMIERIGKSLKRKFGVLISKGRFRNVEKILDNYEPCLTLVYEDLDPISGLDLVGTIRNQIPEAPPMVVLGNGEQEEKSRNKSISQGAHDYYVIEPFQPVSFFKMVGEVLKTFEPEPEPEEPKKSAIAQQIADKIAAMKAKSGS